MTTVDTPPGASEEKAKVTIATFLLRIPTLMSARVMKSHMDLQSLGFLSNYDSPKQHAQSADWGFQSNPLMKELYTVDTRIPSNLNTTSWLARLNFVAWCNFFRHILVFVHGRQKCSCNWWVRIHRNSSCRSASAAELQDHEFGYCPTHRWS